ncbi:uncharacterized protein PSFLO_02814 [Pseudozyma flocculosa]|uniref:Uncharacterized protein n=1 Tax=Pseudozyma flocculosa TaxID=84751 RepID=A0A5C3F223_9BASI|nr:uncharacterized protein PSFLO_02814 [Pseudozyma flocculosa]
MSLSLAPSPQPGPAAVGAHTAGCASMVCCLRLSPGRIAWHLVRTVTEAESRVDISQLQLRRRPGYGRRYHGRPGKRFGCGPSDGQYADERSGTPPAGAAAAAAAAAAWQEASSRQAGAKARGWNGTGREGRVVCVAILRRRTDDATPPYYGIRWPPPLVDNDPAVSRWPGSAGRGLAVAFAVVDSGSLAVRTGCDGERLDTTSRWPACWAGPYMLPGVRDASDPRLPARFFGRCAPRDCERLARINLLPSKQATSFGSSLSMAWASPRLLSRRSYSES